MLWNVKRWLEGKKSQHCYNSITSKVLMERILHGVQSKGTPDAASAAKAAALRALGKPSRPAAEVNIGNARLSLSQLNVNLKKCTIGIRYISCN